LPPGDELYDQELPEARNRFESCPREVRSIVYPAGREHGFSTVFAMGNIGRGDVELLQVVAQLNFMQRAFEFANLLFPSFGKLPYSSVRARSNSAWNSAPEASCCQES